MHEFVERLLGIMERKVHWAWPSFTSGLVPKDRLHIHLEQEYGVYVRDFPVLVGRAYVQCPIAAVRRELAENIYEEETGGIRAGRPHPELFLEYPRGLGMDLSRFDNPILLPQSRAFRGLLDDATTQCGWAVATAVTTLFLEGTSHDRSVLDPSAPRRPEPPFEEHPLVKHYGLPLESLALSKAHRSVEGEHRAAAWAIARDHIPASEHAPVIDTMEAVLAAWLAYRDGVAEAVGLEQPTIRE
ncbi:MAG: iron-containing redox enzyme family protein [Deltaproteobacteria bacterium]|nr:iron-containing redox enzyme family protein [Deltaproteobacteria bacterium]